MITAAPLHKMTIIDLPGIDGIVDQYQWLTDYFGGVSDCWLSELIFQLIFSNGENLPIKIYYMYLNGLIVD